ncbi:integral membrane sensor domain MASE1 [Amycolatopsis bartoniae]|uniref:Uncharacterized protein n=1 Tax=Amycolatopsis bartoniae TaxID=941986 RepID=A0A8H9M780_9PSEU|nr:hypothetical protein [Amycolatopsis bartoniae]MBB2933752.1 integral membrane sensor domain MASE1 [Amycolatopsis bartoniae]TVT10582.1 hypothetical protein FNH07_04965 [Amycolatopsis bartoniae]GHF71937.1 hypothetical protein GCM10017566_52100 [Amycolatopsis bartoniae]
MTEDWKRVHPHGWRLVLRLALAVVAAYFAMVGIGYLSHASNPWIDPGIFGAVIAGVTGAVTAWQARR